MNPNSISSKLQELFDLFNSGALSQEEYNQLKSEILNVGSASSAKPKESIIQPSRQNTESNQPNLQNEVRKVVFEDKLKTDPLNAVLLHEYAQFLFEHNYFEASVSAYLKILALNENDAVAQDLLFSLYKKLNWNKDALLAGEKLLLRKPDDILLLEELAKISGQLGQINKTNDYYERILILQPQNQNALYNKGVTHIANNQLEAAIEIFKSLHAGGLTDRITAIYTGIGKTISGDYKAAILLLKPLLSTGKQAGINDNRAMLYLTHSLCESSVDLDEISQKFPIIDFNVLKKNYQLIDEQTAVKITEYVVKRKLSTISSQDNPELKLNQLSGSYLNLDYFTKISNPNIAELWFAIGSKQKELELYDQAKVSYRIAHNLMPEDALYQNKDTEIEELFDARNRKKKRNRMLTITSIATLVIAIIALIYAFQNSELIFQNKENNIVSQTNLNDKKYDTLTNGIAKAIVDSILKAKYDATYYELNGSHPTNCNLYYDTILIYDFNHDKLSDIIAQYSGEDEFYGKAGISGWIVLLNNGRSLESLTTSIKDNFSFLNYNLDTLIGDLAVYDGPTCCPTSNSKVKYIFAENNFKLISESLDWIDTAYYESIGIKIPKFSDDNLSLDEVVSLRQEFLDGKNQKRYSTHSDHTYTLDFNSPYIDKSRDFEPIYIKTGIQRAYFINSEKVCIQRKILGGQVVEEIHFHPNGKVYTVLYLRNGQKECYAKYVDLDDYVFLQGNLKNSSLVGFWDTPTLGHFDMQNSSLANTYPGIVNSAITFINFYKMDSDTRRFSIN